MIRQFGLETCLLLIDVQVGVDDVVHWGGEKGRRNNTIVNILIKGEVCFPLYYSAINSHIL